MPTILAGIAENASANPRHIIEAAKEIRQVATGGDSTNRPAGSDRFFIKIDLSAGGGPVEIYDKSKTIDPTDGDGPNNLLEGKPNADAW
jgi:hypothetical protein